MRRLWMMLLALGVLAGCNSGAVNTPCSGGPTEEGICVEGAVCAPDRSPTEEPPADPNAEVFYCRQLCDSEADCTEPGYACRQVVGSMARACQPVDEPASPDAGT